MVPTNFSSIVDNPVFANNDAPNFGGIATILNREFKYRQSKAVLDASGTPSQWRALRLSDIRRWDERAALTIFADAILSGGRQNEDGSVGKFTPTIMPFHSDSNGQPLTQLRMFLYSPKPENGMLPMTELIFRMEPHGYQDKFDAESKYSASKQVAEEHPVAVAA